jgi:hypothetical protein
MAKGLRLTIVYDDPDMLQILVSASNGQFCGETQVYVGIAELEEAAEVIRGFPAEASDVREIVFGQFGSAWGGVSLRFFCTDRSGHANVDVRIESGPYYTALTQSAALTIPVEGSALDSFVPELIACGRNRSGVAWLKSADHAA